MSPARGLLGKQRIRGLGVALALAVVLLVSAPGAALGAVSFTAGPNNAGAGASGGTGAIAWSNPGNITTPGSPYATANGITPGSNSKQLRATGYGFNIPESCTIDGITVSIMRRSTVIVTYPLRDQVVQLVKDGSTPIGTNMAATTTDWPTSMGSRTYGSTSANWGSTWTAAEINSSNFGVVLQAVSPAYVLNRDATVDYIQVTVSYHDGVSPGTASVTAPASTGHYTWPAVPATFSGTVADNPGGAGLPADSTTFTLQRPSDNYYWNGFGWQEPLVNLATTHSATTSGTEATWSGPSPMPNWSLEPEGVYAMQVTATDKGGNVFVGSATSFTLKNQVTLTYTPSIGGTIDGDSPQVVSYPGSGTEVVAIAAEDYHFNKWSDGDTNAARTDVDRTTNLDVTALFGKDITVDATGENKVYDGSTDATVVLGSEGVDPDDDVTFSYTSATFDDKDVADGIPISVSGISISGPDADKYYVLNDTATTSANITPMPIVGAFTVNNKVYDGLTGVTVATRSLPAAFPGDDAVLVGGLANFADKNIGTWTVTLTGASITGAQAGNYTLSSVDTMKADITVRPLVVKAVSDTKAYDGDASSDGAPVITFGTLVTGDIATWSQTFDDKNVGDSKTLTPAGTVKDADTADMTANYDVTFVPVTTGEITELHLIGAFTSGNKVYDGLTDAVAVVRSLPTAISGDDVTLIGGTAAFDDKMAGVGKTVTLTGAYLSGAGSDNYILDSVETTTADIEQAPLTVTAVSETKLYDGNTSSAVKPAIMIGTLVAGDTGTWSQSFDNRHVGTGKTLTPSGTVADAADGDMTANYDMTLLDVKTGEITPLHITGTFAASDKAYDGSTDASVTSRSLVGVLGEDDVDLVDGTAAFASKNLGSWEVTLTGAGLSGDDAGNYALDSVAATEADITAKALTVTGAQAADKEYDATTEAKTDFGDASLDGVVSGEDVSLDASVGVGTFEDRNAGTDKDVLVTGLVLVGADISNYTLTQPTLSADIDALPIDGSFTAENKVFDGTTAATVATRSLIGVLSDDDVHLSGGAATFDDENVGTDKDVALTGASLTGDDAGNYELDTVQTATADITPADTIRMGGNSRYDVTVATARSAFPGWTGVKHVVLASGEDRAQPDALTAAGLAGVLDAPLMLVPYESVNSSVGNAIKGMPAGVKVHIVGGTGSVSSNVEKQLRAYHNVGSVDRIAGSNRYGTAASVARRMKTELVAQGSTLPTTTLITNGNIPSAMYDSLAASAISAHNYFPVLLVQDGSVPAETSAALADLGLTKRYIIGGPASVGDSVATFLGVSAGNRIAGPNRFSTATAAAGRAKTEGWLSNTVVGFAAMVPDAATGGAYMGKKGGALVYVKAEDVPAETAGYLTGVKGTINGGIVFGGISSVSESVRGDLDTLIK